MVDATLVHVTVCVSRRVVVGVHRCTCSATQCSGSAGALTDERAEEHAGHHQRNGFVHVDQHNLNGLSEHTDTSQTRGAEMAEKRGK